MEATNETVAETVIEINAPEAVVAPAVPTREEVRAKGWSKAEMDSAEKRGLIAKTEEPAAKPEEKKEFPPEQTEAKAEPVKPASSLPDFEFKTPEQEKSWLEAFGPGTPQRGLYFRMKSERQARQNAEAKAKDLEARLTAFETAKAAPAPAVDELGQVIDPDNQPLTLRALREMQKAEMDAYAKQQAEQAERNNFVASAQADQEEFAKTIYPDFNESVGLALEIKNNLDAILTDPKKRGKFSSLWSELQDKAAKAHTIPIGERNASDVAYEIGQLHPKYGVTADKTGIPKDPKANGGLTAEQMKRIEANTQRRASSASVPAGGGKRTISPEDMDLKTLAGMDYKARSAFAKAHPAVYDKLRRG